VSGYEIFYLLDAEDRFLDWGGPAWEGAARDGRATRLATANLTGDRIYDHVAGHFTQRFLRAFFAEARAAPGGLRRTYRCDAPRTKRLMEMWAEPMGEGTLRVRHRLIDETPMAFEVTTRETGDVMGVGHLRCSMCNRLRRRGSREWLEPDALPPAAGPIAVFHTICTDCRRGVAARLPIPAKSAGLTPPAAPPSSN